MSPNTPLFVFIILFTQSFIHWIQYKRLFPFTV